MAYQCLFVGAHPDDIEIGAGALLQAVAAEGMSVWAVVVSDEGPGTGELRRGEAVKGMAKVGLDSDRVIFLGQADGRVMCDKRTVAAFRRRCTRLGIAPDLVVTHTSADSHQDHRQVNELCRASFRGVAFLFFSAYTSVEVGRFQPRVFVELTPARQTIKAAAIDCHTSQHERLSRVDRQFWEHQLGRRANLTSAEGFELEGDLQSGVGRSVLELNESHFHRLWLRLAETGPLTLLSEDRVSSREESALYAPQVASAGIDALRRALMERLMPYVPITDLSSESYDAPRHFDSGNVVVVGGPVANRFSRDYVNHLPQMRWIIDYNFTGYPITDIFLRNRWSETVLYPEVGRNGMLQTDRCLVTIARHPTAKDFTLVSIAGIHRVGTQGGLYLFAEPGDQLDVLLDLVNEAHDTGLAQRLLMIDARTLDVLQSSA